jgi:hypothetical protein
MEPCFALLPPPQDFLSIGLYFAIGRRFTPRPCLLLTAPQLINRRLIRCPLLLLVTKCYCYLLGNRMLWFGILDCLIFLPRSFSALLMADVSVMAIFCVVASMAKTLSRSRPSRVEVHQWWHPWTVPPRPRRTRWIHHRRRSPRPEHWWLHQKVRRWMIILVTMIPTF